MKLHTIKVEIDASAITKVIEEYAADVAQIVAQRDDLLAALIVAREIISTDRNVLAECCTDSDGVMDDIDAAAVADYDAALLQIDAAIAKATASKPT